MTDALLLIVLGAVLIAIVVDIRALLSWVQATKLILKGGSDMKLFSVLEVYKGRRCHWYVAWRKQQDADVPPAAREFFTEQEAATFVKFARRHLRIPRLTVAPMTTPPTKSFEDQVVEAGWKPAVMEVGFDPDFCVGCFEEGDRNPEGIKHRRAVDAALKEMEKDGLIESHLDERTGERLFNLTEKGRSGERS